MYARGARSNNRLETGRSARCFGQGHGGQEIVWLLYIKPEGNAQREIAECPRHLAGACQPHP